MKGRFVQVAMMLSVGCLLCASATPQQNSTQTISKQNENAGGTEISFREMVEHFVSGSRVIRFGGHSERIPLRVVVTTEGTVQSATPELENTKWRDQAVSLAKTWRYVPFQRNGKPVLATFSADVNIAPPERRPEPHPTDSSFPEIRNWNSLRITLHRTRCFGTCPSYSLAVSGDGSVIYSGDAFVRYCGNLQGQVSQDVIQQLARVFRSADYFHLFDRYAMDITDGTTYTTSIAFDGKSKSVIDYEGLWVGMPESVTDIEDTVDRLAGPNAWAKEKDANGDVNFPCRP